MEPSFGIQLAVALAKCVFAIVFVMNIVPLLIWGERKVSAFIQDRPGPNRAHVMGIRAAGLVHTLVDVVKLIVKEDIVPDHVEKGYWFAAPVIAMSVSLVTFAVIPWGDYLQVTEDLRIPLQVADINGGLLYTLAIGSLGVYGIMLAGWASNNKFSLLGGLRSSAQLISYELAMGLSVVVMFLCFGTVELDEIVRQQSGSIFNWGIFKGFPIVGLLAFILFWTSVFAETNRLPFDMPEGEAELVAGYHLEYSSLRFALFFMAEYANMIVGSAVTATLFFGGYNLPLLNGAFLRSHIDLVLVGLGVGGALFFAWAASVAYKRRNTPLYKSFAPTDPRNREWKFFTAVWAGAALAHLGMVGLGAAAVASSMPLLTDLIVFAAQLNALVVKILFGCWMMIWVRWTLPRFRYDQLMNLGWRYMLPLALANVGVAALWILIDAQALGLYGAVP